MHRGGVEARSVEVTEVDAVAEHVQLARRNTEPFEHRQVFGVLQELRIRARRGYPLEAVDDRALGDRVVRNCVEPVHRVDDDRNAGRTCGETAIDTGLRIVRVNDRRLRAPKDGVELA